MQFAKDFWASVHALAIHIEHTPGTVEERRRKIIKTYSAFGPLGRKTAVQQVQLALAELTAVEKLIATAEELDNVKADGHARPTK